MATTQIVEGVQIKTAFFEIRKLKEEGLQFVARGEDLDVSGVVKARSESVVRKLVERVFKGVGRVSAYLYYVIDGLVDYVVNTAERFNMREVTVHMTVKEFDVLETLWLDLVKHEDLDRDISEWRGYVEVWVEGVQNDGRYKRPLRVVVRRHVYFKERIDRRELHKVFVGVARHALGALESDDE